MRNAFVTLKLPDEERLAILQQDGDYRTWVSLDERRYCVRCTKSFNGHEVRIGIRPDGGQELHCPTTDCDSLPLHWFFCGSGKAMHQAGAALPRYGEVDFSDF